MTMKLLRFIGDLAIVVLAAPVLAICGGAKAPSYPPNVKCRPDGTPNHNYRPGSVRPEPPPAPPPKRQGTT